MSVDEESTFCYCLLEPKRCHLLLEQPGRYALMGAPLSQEAAKRLRLAVFGSLDGSNSLGFTLRVYCVDDTPHAFQVRQQLRAIPEVLTAVAPHVSFCLTGMFTQDNKYEKTQLSHF